MNDIEHTEAAPTQAFRAWSQSEDAQIMALGARHHGWWIPVGLCMGAVVAVAIIVGCLFWQGVQAGSSSLQASVPPSAAPSKAAEPAPPPPAALPPPTVPPVAAAPPPVAAPQNPDTRYLSALAAKGITPVSPKDADMDIHNAHEVCGDMSTGHSAEQITEWMYQASVAGGSQGASRVWARFMVDTAVAVYCPQYGR